MRHRSLIAAAALALAALIAFILIRDGRSPAPDIGSSGSGGTPRPEAALPAPGLGRLDQLGAAPGGVTEPATAPPAVPSLPAEPRAPVPLAPAADAARVAPGAAAPAAAPVRPTPEAPAPKAGPETRSAAAATAAPLRSSKVSRMQLASRMQGLEPGPAIRSPIRLAPTETMTLYFFTELRGLNGQPVIHRWQLNGRTLKDRELRPASDAWRAYSGITISGDMRGSWRVTALDAATGKVLAEQRFAVE